MLKTMSSVMIRMWRSTNGVLQELTVQVFVAGVFEGHGDGRIMVLRQFVAMMVLSPEPLVGYTSKSELRKMIYAITYFEIGKRHVVFHAEVDTADNSAFVHTPTRLERLVLRGSEVSSVKESYSYSITYLIHC